MSELNDQVLANYSVAFAFLGNSLLSPMSLTESYGLDPEFWAGFPNFDDAHVAAALDACERYATGAQEFEANGGNPVQRASVEFTRLFVGPPRPLTPPWETMYQPGSEGATVGFGQPTFEMRELLREAGLQIANENNQYADHIGIELLFAAELCNRLAGDQASLEDFVKYLDDHPRSWIGKLRTAVAEAEPEGYIASLLGLAEALFSTF